MNKTARFVLKTVAAGLAFCAFVCLVVGSWSDVYEAIRAPPGLPFEQAGEQRLRR